MKINPINTFSATINLSKNKNSSKNNYTKNEDLTNYLTHSLASISFLGNRRLPLKKINLTNEAHQMLLNKISGIAKKIDAGSSFPARIFETNGKKFAYSINKNENNEATIIIKDLVDTIEDWAKTKLNRSEIRFKVNSEGKTTYAKLEKTTSNGYCRNLTYTLSPTETGTIKTYDGIVLRHSNVNDDIWNSHPSLSKYRLNREFNVKKEFNEYEFSELFFELAKKRASIFA